MRLNHVNSAGLEKSTERRMNFSRHYNACQKRSFCLLADDYQLLKLLHQACVDLSTDLLAES